MSSKKRFNERKSFLVTTISVWSILADCRPCRPMADRDSRVMAGRWPVLLMLVVTSEARDRRQ